MTLAGALAQTGAETLAGITLAWLANPKVKAIYGARPMVTDLRSGGMSGGSGEQALVMAAAGYFLFAKTSDVVEVSVGELHLQHAGNGVHLQCDGGARTMFAGGNEVATGRTFERDHAQGLVEAALLDLADQLGELRVGHLVDVPRAELQQIERDLARLGPDRKLREVVDSLLLYGG